MFELIFTKHITKIREHKLQCTYLAIFNVVYAHLALLGVSSWPAWTVKYGPSFSALLTFRWFSPQISHYLLVTEGRGQEPEETPCSNYPSQHVDLGNDAGGFLCDLSRNACHRKVSIFGFISSVWDRDLHSSARFWSCVDFITDDIWFHCSCSPLPCWPYPLCYPVKFRPTVSPQRKVAIAVAGIRKNYGCLATRKSN